MFYNLLEYYNNYNDNSCLEICINFANYILNSASLETVDKIGFEYGKTGIAFFLCRLYEITNKKELFLFGKNLLLEEVELGEISKEKAYMHPFEKNNTNILFPYFSYGTSGITFVFLEYIKYDTSLQKDKSLSYLLNGLNIFTSVHLGFEKGYCGILFTQIKAVQMGIYKKNDIDIAFNNLANQLIEINDSLYCPGYAMLRCSCDLASGSAGIIYMLSELDQLQDNGR